MKTELLNQLSSLLPKNSAGAAPEVLTEGSPGYLLKSQVFNTKFQFRPAAIVLVETREQVSEIVKLANRFPAELTLRVRSGGHDHEGECSGTATLLMDFSKMNAVTVTWQDAGTEKQPIVSIERGVLANRPWVNRAEDWIEVCRDYPIPSTSGAFISFKDSSVRTQTYFAESYAALREVKQTCSMDKHVLFRSRKTII